MNTSWKDLFFECVLAIMDRIMDWITGGEFSQVRGEENSNVKVKEM